MKDSDLELFARILSRKMRNSKSIMMTKNTMDQFMGEKIDNPARISLEKKNEHLDIIQEVSKNLKILCFYIYFALLRDLIPFELVYI